MRQNIKIHVFLFICSFVYIITSFIPQTTTKFVGVYWGAFDPPTEAHAAIIVKSVKDIPLKKLIVVINNHPYKKYTYPLEKRLEMMRALFQQQGLERVELHWQDEFNQMDFTALKAMTQEPLCAIAGYDAYKKWVSHSKSQERLCYDAIAVIPRGDEEPILLDEIAFLLPIDLKYKDVSSTRVRASLRTEHETKK